MRIKHFVVTHKNNPLLAKCVDSIFAAPTEHDRQVFVISNHSADAVEPREGLTFLRNTARPDFSTGHLARDWNQALIQGFVDLTNPDADLVICAQNDVEFMSGYLDRLLEVHARYDLLTMGAGDSCVSYTPEAVRRIGLWDERFCNIGFQEADYFLRAAKFHGEKVSINDFDHSRLHDADVRVVHDPAKGLPGIIRKTLSGHARGDESHMASTPYHLQSKGMYHAKWTGEPEHWPEGYPTAAEQKLSSFILYPYFEENVETLAEQKYVFFSRCG